MHGRRWFEEASTVLYYGVGKSRHADNAPALPEAGDTPNDKADDGAYRFLKWFPAFNAGQIDGLPIRYYPAADDLDGGARPIADLAAIADAMVAGLGVDYVEGGDRACYIRDLDRIHMPEITRFFDAERFYATKFHELAHSCEVPKRLNIDHGGPKSFGNESYARGELLAECTAAILGATLGFRPDHLEDHAGYIGSWLKALRNDKRFILKAAAEAQRGADYLLAAAGLASSGDVSDGDSLPTAVSRSGLSSHAIGGSP
jgi:antirestriction protein ArdC